MRTALLGLATSLAVLAWGPGRVMAVCGDGVVDGDEDCDQGGTCIGGAVAGTACTADAACTGFGKCTTFGGRGCAANCTTEHDIDVLLVPGALDGLNLLPGTSGVTITSDFISIPLPLGAVCINGTNIYNACVTDDDCPGSVCLPSKEVFTVGRDKDGKIPMVVKARSVRYPGIPVTTLACGCVHGISAKTCGGSVFDTNGLSLSPNCTPGFLAGSCSTAACTGAGDICEGKSPCAFVHGEGNTAFGEIGCAGGLDNTDYFFTIDSGPNSTGIDPQGRVVFSGHGGPGSALLFQTLGITAALGPCTGTDPTVYGPDGIFCTDDDPFGGLISSAGLLPVVTGTAQAQVFNANGVEGAKEPPEGPISATGAPFNCTALECGEASSAAGGGLAGAFAFVHLDTVGDVAVAYNAFVSGTLPDPAVCIACIGTPGFGTCGAGKVTPANLNTMLVMALGGAAACSGSDPDGNGVEIYELVAAVQNAVNGCEGFNPD